LDSNLNNNDEAIEEVKSLTPKRKPAGRPNVRPDTSRPTKIGGNSNRVLYPGLGGVTLVIH
jgi:hypothetical protein